jgi:hypothetical protein
MDDQRFDALVREWSGGPSRRTVLTGLAGAALGGVLSLLGEDLGQAARGRKNDKRQKTRDGKSEAKALRAEKTVA